jgi:hypothetical protein
MQGITVTVAVAAIAGGATPTGTVMLISGSYSSAITTLSSGSALIGIPANALGAGSNTLNAVYTPDAASAPVYRGASGTSLVTVTKVTPIVVVTPSATSISRAQPLTVTVAVNRGSGNVAPGGTVTLASGSYTSAPATLSSGAAIISVPARSLAAGSDTLVVRYAPDSSSSSLYNAATGTSSVVTVTKITPTVVVTPSSTSITTVQSLTVAVVVSGDSGDVTPTGTVTLASGGYASAPVTLSSGTAMISVPARSLAAGSDTLVANYAPDSSSSAIYDAGAGTSSVVTVTKVTPTVVVTPSSTSITMAQSLTVTVAVSGASGVVPTGTVTLASGSYTSAPVTLGSGTAMISVPARSLAVGSDTLVVRYAPDSSSSPIYNASTGTSSVVAVTKITPTVVVTPSATSITTAQALTVTVAVSGGDVTPTGTVMVGSGSYLSAAATLSGGTAIISVPARLLAAGSDMLVASYAPDSSSSPIYNAGAGASLAVTVTASAKITPAVVVTPSSTSITTAQSLTVTVGVSGHSGDVTPTGAVTLTSGSYTSVPAILNSGTAMISVPARSLAAGSDTLVASYAPDSPSFSIYNVASGNSPVLTVTASAKVTPTVVVTPSSTSISTEQALGVTVAVNGDSGDVTPTGTVTLTSGSYTSAPATLSSGTAMISVPARSLAAGSDTLVASYAPDSLSSSIYNVATGNSSAVTVTVLSVITVDQSNLGPAVTDRIQGMNMAYWYDPSTPAIVPALKTAGIKTIRWPGGSGANDYHWATNSLCSGGYTAPASAFDTFIADFIQPGDFDLALAVNYATDVACTGPGDPAEAAAWVQNAINNGNYVSHVTVGNEGWGAWEPDLHTIKHDPATYAAATANGYYPQIKAVNPNVLVGVGVNPWNSPAWDPIVLSQAKYDFVEYHFYPQTPGSESDTILVQQAAQQLTTAINAIKAELQTAGSPTTPIFIGEIGSVYDDPGKQTSSITQALFAGQVLGEMMNDGVSLATWWLGFGGCTNNPSAQNFSSALYGWQSFGGYMVFSDGLPENGCQDSAFPTLPAGTLLPTARAFQLFSKVAINGENVLTANVTGDTTDVRAYAATNNGGTALVLFNLNKTVSEPVEITLSGQSATSSVTVATYSKAIYDKSQNNIWAPPTNTDLGAQSLPLALTLDPWSMNVVMIK